MDKQEVLPVEHRELYPVFWGRPQWRITFKNRICIYLYMCVYIYVYMTITLLYSRNWHIVNQYTLIKKNNPNIAKTLKISVVITFKKQNTFKIFDYFFNYKHIHFY